MNELKVFEYNYKGFWNCDSKCRVYMKNITNPRYGDIMYICFEDMGIGRSVTNFSENLATQIVQKFNLDPKKTRFFETYPPVGNEKRELDEIKYTWDDLIAMYPQWSRPELDVKHVFDLN